MIPKENVIAEPAARNTAPCIGLAAGIIQKKYGEDAVMLVLPSDHLIKFNAMFVDTLRKAVSVAEDNANLVTIGITPTYPETGYGYINFAANEYVNGAYKVISFVEKPNMEKAKEYVRANIFGTAECLSGKRRRSCIISENTFPKCTKDLRKYLIHSETADLLKF